MAAVFVIGVARGGTTAVTGVLRHLGVAIPDCNAQLENCELAVQVRPKGIASFGLAAAGYDVAYRLWGVKHPVMAKWPESLHAALQQVAPPGRVLAVWRDPFSVASNLDRAAGGGRADGYLERVVKQQAQVLACTRYLLAQGLSPDDLLQVSYEKLIMDPPGQVERIRQWLGVSPDGVERAVQWVKPGAYQTWVP